MLTFLNTLGCLHSSHCSDLGRFEEANKLDSIFSVGLFLILKECGKALQLFVSLLGYKS